MMPTICIIFCLKRCGTYWITDILVPIQTNKAVISGQYQADNIGRLKYRSGSNLHIFFFFLKYLLQFEELLFVFSYLSDLLSLLFNLFNFSPDTHVHVWTDWRWQQSDDCRKKTKQLHCNCIQMSHLIFGPESHSGAFTHRGHFHVCAVHYLSTFDTACLCMGAEN